MTWDQKLPWIVGLSILVVLVVIGSGMLNTPAASTVIKAASSLQLSVHQSQQVPSQSSSTYSVVGKPSITVNFINRVLNAAGSPAAGKGQRLYDLGVKYGIDPAFALAFFMNESTFGTQGMATSTLALGNERCLSDRLCVNTRGLPCQVGQSCYAQFTSWEDGFDHWYRLIHDEYITGHINRIIGKTVCPCTTVPQIIPVYAPGSDNNDEAHYIWVVEHAVASWREGKVQA